MPRARASPASAAPFRRRWRRRRNAPAGNMDRWAARSGFGRCNAPPSRQCRGLGRLSSPRRALRLRRAASECQAKLRARKIPPPVRPLQVREICMGRGRPASVRPGGRCPFFGRIWSLARRCRSRYRHPMSTVLQYNTGRNFQFDPASAENRRDKTSCVSPERSLAGQSRIAGFEFSRQKPACPSMNRAAHSLGSGPIHERYLDPRPTDPSKETRSMPRFFSYSLRRHCRHSTLLRRSSVPLSRFGAGRQQAADRLGDQGGGGPPHALSGRVENLEAVQVTR